MKNIHEILIALGIEIPADKKADLDKELLANYKTIADYDKQAGNLTVALDKLKTAEDGLKAFEGVDLAELKGQIVKLQGDLTTKDAAYAAKLADMEFDRAWDGAVTTAKGRNSKVLRALLDEDALKTLKASKNQEADIKASLEALKKDNGYLFDSEQTPPNYAPGPGTQINNPNPAASQFNFGFTGVRAAPNNNK